MAILVVERYFEWARDIADETAVIDCGAIVLSGTRAEMDERAASGRMTVQRPAFCVRSSIRRAKRGELS